MVIERLYIVKIGGNIIDDEGYLKSFLNDFSRIKNKKILVHGGGKTATEVSRSLGIEPKLSDGRRITDKETLKVVTMVYAGLVNKNICAHLQSLGCNAIGLTGADANIIPAVKRKAGEIDFGFAGDIDSNKINSQILNLFLEHWLVPVIAPITHDEKGSLLNTNSDTIASETAAALSDLYETALIYAFEKEGVLNKNETVISQITSEDYRELLENKIIKDGMLPKLSNAFKALHKGVSSVTICHYSDVKDIINHGKTSGTKIIS
jgi:acetylglutamate kinase